MAGRWPVHAVRRPILVQRFAMGHGKDRQWRREGYRSIHRPRRVPWWRIGASACRWRGTACSAARACHGADTAGRARRACRRRDHPCNAARACDRRGTARACWRRRATTTCGAAPARQRSTTDCFWCGRKLISQHMQPVGRMGSIHNASTCSDPRCSVPK